MTLMSIRRVKALTILTEVIYWDDTIFRANSDAIIVFKETVSAKWSMNLWTYFSSRSFSTACHFANKSRSPKWHHQSYQWQNQRRDAEHSTLHQRHQQGTHIRHVNRRYITLRQTKWYVHIRLPDWQINNQTAQFPKEAKLTHVVLCVMQ